MRSVTLTLSEAVPAIVPKGAPLDVRTVVRGDVIAVIVPVGRMVSGVGVLKTIGAVLGDQALVFPAASLTFRKIR